MADTAKGLKSFKKGLADADDAASSDLKVLGQARDGERRPMRRRSGSKATTHN